MKANFPILEWFPRYRRDDLRGDVVAALTVAVMLIPQSMAVALLAGLPPIVGLYASVAAGFLYPIFGTSRHLAVGPVALVSLLVASGIGDLAEPFTPSYVVYATLLAALVGIIQVAMGVARFGFLVNFLSLPVISGFTWAAAVIIALSQLENVLGIPHGELSHGFTELPHILDSLSDINGPTAAIGLSSLVALAVLKRWKATFPRALVVVIVTTSLVRIFHLEEAGVAIVGHVPRGLPPLGIPDFDPVAVRRLTPIAVAIALVGFMESITIAKRFAKERGYEVDASQELTAVGLANLGTSMLGGYPVTGSFSRSAVSVAAGARTGVTSLLAAVAIALTLLFLTGLFYHLPTATLGAVIIIAVSSLVDLKELGRLYRVKRTDLASLVVTFFATLFLGVELGIALSIVVSAILVAQRTTRPHHAILGRLPETNLYRNIDRWPEARTIDGVIMIRIDSSLYFANVSFFKDLVDQEVSRYRGHLKAVVLDASSINDIDSSADAALKEVTDELRARGVTFCVTNVKGPVRDMLRRSGSYDRIGSEHFFLRNHDAIRYLVGENGVVDALMGSADSSEGSD